MRRPTAILALALCLLGCGSAASSGESAVPSGTPVGSAIGHTPVGLVTYGRQDMTCQDHQWVEGLLRGDMELKNRITSSSQGPITLEISRFDRVDWPATGERARFVPVYWPTEYRGVRLAGGEVAVLDGAGHVVATTGRRYRLKGEWAMEAAIGGSLFGAPPWIDSFDACRDSGSVIPE
jgi:hypothetical protein